MLRSAVAADSLPPYAPGVHVAAIPGFANAGIGDINDFGEVVGTTTGIAKWQVQRGTQLLALPNGETGFASGVNDMGQVAITLETDTSEIAAIWGWFGTVTPLRLLSTYESPNPNFQKPTCIASGITNLGIAYGNCTVEGAAFSFPTRWTKFGTPDGLHPAGGSAVIEGQLTAASDSGYVVGLDEGIQTGQRGGFVFTPGNVERIVPGYGGQSSFATLAEPLAVNDSGYAAGSAQSTAYQCTRAVAWLKSDSIQDLGICGQAMAMSDDGIIVGRGGSGNGFAWVWTAATGIQRLPGLEGGAALAAESSYPVAMNHVHQVLGFVVTSAGVVDVVIWTLPKTL